MSDTVVKYFAVYRSDSQESADAGYSSICTGLFTELAETVLEAQRLLEDGWHVSIEQGTMLRADWDALEEVPDDFVASHV